MQGQLSLSRRSLSGGSQTLAEHYRAALCGALWLLHQKLNFTGTAGLTTPNNPTSLGVLEKNKVALED